MKLDMQVRFGPGHIVLDGPSSPSPKGAQPPIFGHICCGQMAAWIKMSLGMELSLGPGHFVLDGDPASPSPISPPIFGPCLLWQNGWIDEAGTWHGGRPQPRRLCVRWGPIPSRKRGRSSPPSPIFSPFLLWPHGWMNQDATWHEGRPQPRRLCVRWGPNSPPKREPKAGDRAPNLRPMAIVAERLDGSRWHLAWT